MYSDVYCMDISFVLKTKDDLAVVQQNIATPLEVYKTCYEEHNEWWNRDHGILHGRDHIAIKISAGNQL